MKVKMVLAMPGLTTKVFLLNALLLLSILVDPVVATGRLFSPRNDTEHLHNAQSAFTFTGNDATLVAETCSGSTASAALPAVECAAWIAIYDTTGGGQWSTAGCERLNPCGCSGKISSGVTCRGKKITQLDTLEVLGWRARCPRILGISRG